MSKEYGGYLSLEYNDKEFYNDTDQYETIRLNAARYAIVQACKDAGNNKVLLPIYLCSTVSDTLKSYHIDYSLYNIDKSFRPIIEEPFVNGTIIIVNYYGLFDEAYFGQYISRFTNVIFDNTQSFYSMPCIQKGVYNIYSPRKFFGVSDGAYLITKSINKDMIFDRDESASRCGFLFKSIELGTNSQYAEYLKAEEELCSGKTLEMSLITRRLLNNIDYRRVYDIRKRNFIRANKILRDINELAAYCDYAELSEGVCPMVYPLLIKNDLGNEVRKKLVALNIYIPQWWKYSLFHSVSNDFEKHLSQDLIPIPIDQRYNLLDIEYITKKVLLIVSECVQ